MKQEMKLRATTNKPMTTLPNDPRDASNFKDIKQSNTYLHWAALALARYYDRQNEAVFVRDIHPIVEHIFDQPDRTQTSLYKLYKRGVVDAVESSTQSTHGGEKKSLAYYPTKVTIENLRQLGSPTKYPSGDSVPDTVDLSVPDAYVGSDENVDTPETTNTGLKYEYDKDRQYKITDDVVQDDTDDVVQDDTDDVVQDDTDEPELDWPMENNSDTESYTNIDDVLPPVDWPTVNELLRKADAVGRLMAGKSYLTEDTARDALDVEDLPRHDVGSSEDKMKQLARE